MNPSGGPLSEPDPYAFLAGGGEMGRLIRSMDWSGTALGPVESWPQSLRTTVNICLASDLPICVIWGPGLVQIYNDGYRIICGDKHPRSMGQNFPECWIEAWPVIGAAHDSALAGDTAFLETQHIYLERYGYVEECFFTFSFSPIRDEAGRVGGLFHPVIEMTTKMLSERRTRTLRDVAARTAKAKTVEEACTLAIRAMADYDLDLPFASIYLFDEGGAARPVAAAGLRVESESAASETWPLAEVFRTGRAVVIENADGRFGPSLCGPYAEAPRAALALPLTRPGCERPVGVLLAGVSGRLKLDPAYRDFYDLIASGVSTVVASSRAYEEERRRAEALAELDRAKTAFFNNVSHEFRTPLTLMLGPVEDLLTRDRADLSPAVAGQLEVVNRNGLRLLRLVNSLLDFSRIEAGRVRAVYRPTDLAAFTAELASVFRSACERAGLRLTVDCPPLREPVYVDREMWEKVVLNLLSNAFKFTFEGEIAVALRIGEPGVLAPGVSAVELTVRDTGTGVPAAGMPRLFERFHRVENAKGRIHEGSGIGLALVQELVKLHGGSIAAESVVGTGTTFTVSVPLGSIHLPPDQIGPGHETTPAGTWAMPYVEEALRWLPAEIRSAEFGVRSEDENTGSDLGFHSALRTPHSALPRVLVADDNADMREYVARLLAEHYRIQTVPDGEAALAAARDQPPDLILTDVMMPRLDGFGLLLALRADPRTSGVPVIMLSARAGEESRVEGMEAGADDYLIKPFGARELLARVGAHLQMAKMRREANESIRASEERFRALVSATSDVVYRVSADWTEMRHLRGREFIADTHEPSRSWLEKYIHPDDRPLVLETIHAAIRAKGVFELEHRVVRVDGTLGWTFSRAIPLLDGDGEIVEWFGAASDVTNRKRAEETLRKSEARYRSVADSAPNMLWVTDATGMCVYLSRRWYEFTGRTPEQDLGFGWQETVHPDDRPHAGATLFAATEQRIPFSLDHRLRRGDGEYRWVVDAGVPRFDAAGQFQGHIGAVTDVHERRLAEDALAEAHRFLQLSIDALSSHIAILDENGIILAVNDAWRRFADENQFVAHNHGVGSNYVEACEPNPEGLIAAGTVTSGLGDVLRGRTANFEVEYHCHSPSEERWFIMRVSRFKSPGPVRVVVSHENVTVRRKAEEKLKVADRRKDEFLATLAHELRNPLAPIRNGLQIIRLAGADGTIEQARIMMDRQLTQMVRLVDDLLDVSRVTTGKLGLRKERVELKTVIDTAVETSLPMIEQAGHEFTLKIPGEPIFVDGDPTRLAQVVSNLLNNSAKYTHRGGRIRLTVELASRAASAPGADVVVSVADDGIGIPPDMLETVFGMFAQVDRTLEKTTGGLGIGLSLVKGLVEMHGGTIEARSEGEGRGSAFVVRLPLATPEARESTPAAGEVRRVEPSGSRRILVVDDNVDSADSLAQLLELLGNEVRTAHDGIAGVGAAGTFRPDVVLMDIGMPKMNGYEACRHIRGQAWGREMVLVALTGWGQDDDRRKTSDAGFDHHLVKPVETATLMKLLTTMEPATA